MIDPGHGAAKSCPQIKGHSCQKIQTADHIPFRMGGRMILGEAKEDPNPVCGNDDRIDRRRIPSPTGRQTRDAQDIAGDPAPQSDGNVLFVTDKMTTGALPLH